MTREELIKAMAQSAIIDEPHASVCLSIMCGRIPGLSDVLKDKAVIVPKEATFEMEAAGSEGAVVLGRTVIWMAALWSAMLSKNPYARKPTT